MTYFLGYLNTDWNYDPAEYGDVPFDANYYDPDSVFNTTTGRFEPATDGFYRFSGQIQFAHDDAVYYTVLLINSDEEILARSTVYPSDTDDDRVTVAFDTIAEIDADVDEEVWVRIVVSTANEDTVAKAGFVRSFFAGELIEEIT